MAKGYWIAFYRSISDQDVLSKYGQLAQTNHRIAWRKSTLTR